MIWTSFVTFSSLQAVAACPGLGNRIMASGSSIAKAEMEAEVEGAFEKTNVSCRSSSFPASSDEAC